MCSMSVQTASVKDLSWDTMMTTLDFQTGLVARVFWSHSTPSMARWFVGSSSSSMSGLAKRAAARATRTRHPPDNAFIGLERRASEKPRLMSMLRARAGALSASHATSFSITEPSFKAASPASTLSPSEIFSSSCCSSISSSRSMSAASTISTGLTSSCSAANGSSCAT
mmetsp:Transcript_40392/g.96007  ORF Transcript_40392/g.96007 Transcript_40392/m.96007 type:complete len:169 (-) Transcript_40392:808-1314(-)